MKYTHITIMLVLSVDALYVLPVPGPVVQVHVAT